MEVEKAGCVITLNKKEMKRLANCLTVLVASDQKSDDSCCSWKDYDFLIKLYDLLC